MDERPESPQIDESSNSGAKITISFVFSGSNDYAYIRTQALLLSPVYILYADQVCGRSDVNVKQQPGTFGYVDVVYSAATTEAEAIQPEGMDPPAAETPSDSDKLGSNWSLTTKGGTRHVTQSKETMSKTLALSFSGITWQATHAYAVGDSVTNGGKSYTCVAPGISAGSGGPTGIGSGIIDGTAGWNYTSDAPAAPDNQRAIGLNKDGVTGVEVPAMKVGVSITFPTDLRLPLVRTLVRIDEPKTNSAAWLGFAPLELLYTGMEAQGGDTNRGSLTMHFDGGENIPAGDPRLIISTTLTLPQKNAHDYVWVLYTDTISNGVLFQTPRAAYVERLFDSINFAEVFGFG